MCSKRPLTPKKLIQAQMLVTFLKGWKLFLLWEKSMVASMGGGGITSPIFFPALEKNIDLGLQLDKNVDSNMKNSKKLLVTV